MSFISFKRDILDAAKNLPGSTEVIRRERWFYVTLRNGAGYGICGRTHEAECPDRESRLKFLADSWQWMQTEMSEDETRH